MKEPPINDAAPLAGGAGVTNNEPTSDSIPPPKGVPENIWLKLARRDGSRWEIPERDQTGEIIGTAYRDAAGNKFFTEGGKRGLILAWPLDSYAGTSEINPIYICEGASDTAAMLSLGLIAVGAPMAGHCGKMLAELLANRHVVQVAHADLPGRNGAQKQAKDLIKRCASLRIIEPPNGEKDARDAVIAGADRAAFESLANAAERIEPEPAPPTSGPVLTCMDDVKSQKVRWLWLGRVPLGRITLLVGRPGEGKSFLSVDMAAHVSCGRPWPDGSPCPAGSVLLVSVEDNPHDTIRPRLDAANADARHVHLLSAVRRTGKNGQPAETMFTLADVAELELALLRHPDCRLIVIDPIGSFLGDKIDSNRDNEVRSVLTPIAKLADQYGVAVLLIAHRRKSSGNFADDLALGSRAFTGIARSAWHLMRDPKDKNRRLLLPGKNNLAKEGSGLAFSITGDPPALAWEPDPVLMHADDALAAENNGARERSELDDAADWLHRFLADGPRPSSEIENEAKSAGYSLMTVRRAKAAIGVVAKKLSFDGPWFCTLPTHAQDEPIPKTLTQDSQTGKSDHLGKNIDENADNRREFSQGDQITTLEHLGPYTQAIKAE